MPLCTSILAFNTNVDCYYLIEFFSNEMLIWRCATKFPNCLMNVLLFSL